MKNKLLELGISKLSVRQLQDILTDLDHLWETDSSPSTLKFMEPIYDLLFNQYHSIKDTVAKTLAEHDQYKRDNAHHYMDDKIELGEKPGYHFLYARRLEWTSDISENCQCALWTLWEKGYEHKRAKDIPITKEEIRTQLNKFANMTQEERNDARLYIADGLYEKEGVEIPCPVCGFQVESGSDYHDKDETTTPEKLLSSLL